MTAAELEQAVIRAIVDLLSDRIVERLRARSRSALVLFTGTELGLAKAAAALAALREDGWDLRAVLSPRARPLLTAERAALLRLGALLDGTRLDGTDDPAEEALFDGRPLLLVPTLTVTTAAKVAAGQRDSLASWLVARALERGVRVVAAFDGCCPDNPARAARGFLVAEPYKALMRANLQTLRSFGVELVPAAGLARAAGGPATRPAMARLVMAPPVMGSVAAAASAAPAKRVFGRTDAALWQGDELRVDGSLLVTPAAADELRRRNIRLVEA